MKQYLQSLRTPSINVNFIVSQIDVCMYVGLITTGRNKGDTKGREERERENCLHIERISIIILLIYPPLSFSLSRAHPAVSVYVYVYEGVSLVSSRESQIKW